MSLWRDNTITRQEWEQLMEDKVNPWTLRSPMTTLTTENPNTSTATNMGT